MSPLSPLGAFFWLGVLMLRLPACPELCTRVRLLTLYLPILTSHFTHRPAAASPDAGATGLALPTFTDAPIRSLYKPARAARAARRVSARTATGCAYPLPTRMPRSARPVRDPARPAPPRPVPESLFVWTCMAAMG